MPNHFLTIGLCGRDYAKAESKGIDDMDEIDLSPINGVNFCELLMPLPCELKSVVATKPRVRFVHKVTGEVLNDCNGPSSHEESLHYDRAELSAIEESDLIAKYGACDWFEWQTKNWGTKWGTYSTKVQELGGDGSPVLVEFETAWGPPNAEMMRMIDDYLCQTHCFKDIKWLGHNPFDNSTIAIEVSVSQSV